MSIKCFAFSLSCALVAVFGFMIEGQSVIASRFAKSNDDDIKSQLINLNEKLVGAEVRRDMSVLDDRLTDNYVHVHTNGWVESKTDFLADFSSGKRIYHSVDLQDVHAQVYDKSVLIMGNAHVKSASEGEKDNVNRFLAVWVQQQGKWRLAEWMTTRLQDPRTPWEASDRK
jgi:hypothetical protein